MTYLCQPQDKFDIVLANPPFSGGERKEIQQNFAIQTGQTSYLFLQHFIKYLRAGGRAAMVIANTFLSNTDNAVISLRKMLLADCRLDAVLDMPSGTFQGAGVQTVVLFFEKGESTQGDIWYYQLSPGRTLGKTTPLNDDDMTDFVRKYPKRTKSKNSWLVRMADVDAEKFDLSVKNPNDNKAIPLRAPKEIMAEMADLDKQSAKIMKNIDEILRTQKVV